MIKASVKPTNFAVEDCQGRWLRELKAHCQFWPIFTPPILYSRRLALFAPIGLRLGSAPVSRRRLLS